MSMIVDFDPINGENLKTASASRLFALSRCSLAMWHSNCLPISRVHRRLPCRTAPMQRDAVERPKYTMGVTVDTDFKELIAWLTER
jgi:hypothetical protein